MLSHNQDEQSFPFLKIALAFFMLPTCVRITAQRNPFAIHQCMVLINLPSYWIYITIQLKLIYHHSPINYYEEFNFDSTTHINHH